MDTFRGKIWRFGDHVDTDQIIPADRLISQNNNCLGDFLFERVRPDMTKSVSKGDVIVAGKNFGCGSSREHAPRSIKQAGVDCVIAESFARIFYRNSINIGLVLVECKVEAAEGDMVSVDVDKGVVRNETTGGEWTFPEYPQYVKELIASGGLMARIKEGRQCTR
jgi:3-isopropylmalate/(R)-2-methylmalate dehydratase small subunit